MTDSFSHPLAAGDVGSRFEALDRACVEAKRDPASMGRAVGTRVAIAPPGAAAFEFGGMRQMARVGTAAELLEHARTFRAAGVQHLALSLVHPPGPRVSRCSPRSSRACAAERATARAPGSVGGVALTGDLGAGHICRGV